MMPADKPARHRFHECKADPGIENEKESDDHHAPGIGELQRVDHDDAEALLCAEQFAGKTILSAEQVEDVVAYLSTLKE